MKLGSMIPADGSNVEIGDRLSIAKVEGQSKGGILSKACEYIQSLQQIKLYATLSTLLRSKSTNLGFFYFCFCCREQTQCLDSDAKGETDKEQYEKEIDRLRKENDALKSVLSKHGIYYAKECSTFDADEFS